MPRTAALAGFGRIGGPDLSGRSPPFATGLPNRRRKNTTHRLDGEFRQSVYGRLAGYEDVNYADGLALDLVMRQIAGRRAVDAQAASASQMGRFETETLALPENRAALADLNSQWIDRFHDRNGLKYITLDMDSSVSPTHDQQEGTAWNGLIDCTCNHPLFVFNQFGMLERCALRYRNVLSADGRRDVIDPVTAQYAIQLDDAVFTGLAAGALRARAFWADATGLAHDDGDRIIYETGTGNPYFDADGTGVSARIQFAVLAANLTITAVDFKVI